MTMPSKTNVNPGMEGPVAPGHSPEEIQKLRAVTQEARQRQQSGMPPASAQDPQAAPPQAGRVDVTLANRVRDRRVHALRADLMRFGKESQHPQIGMGGAPLPHMIERQRQVQAAIEQAQADVEHLMTLSGDALVSWAETSGLIRFNQAGSAIL